MNDLRGDDSVQFPSDMDDIGMNGVKGLRQSQRSN